MIRLKRWDEPRAAGDGWRILICRYRPRGLPKRDETWDEWIPDAGPSRALHADFYGKHGPPIGWTEYERRYLREMAGRPQVLTRLAERAGRGTITLLCSSRCADPTRCHRSPLKILVERALAGRAGGRRAVTNRHGPPSRRRVPGITAA